MRGTVKAWYADRGFGFISSETYGKDIYVHFTGITSDSKWKVLTKGKEVEFDVTTRQGRDIAINVKEM